LRFFSPKKERGARMRSYTQLTQDQRYQMEALYKAGHSQTMIASVLAVHKSTISRELQRNQDLRGDRPKQAHEKAMQRRYEKLKTHIPLTTWGLVHALIKQDWSPEQISSRLLMEVVFTSTYVARKNGVNVTANRIAGDTSPTALALMNAQLLLPINPGSATGKAIRL
jgi:IS30 family transposase